MSSNPPSDPVSAGTNPAGTPLGNSFPDGPADSSVLDGSSHQDYVTATNAKNSNAKDANVNNGNARNANANAANANVAKANNANANIANSPMPLLP